MADHCPASDPAAEVVHRVCVKGTAGMAGQGCGILMVYCVCDPPLGDFF